MKKYFTAVFVCLALVGCTEVKSGSVNSNVYEIVIPGINLKVAEFTPKAAPNMLCVAITRYDDNAAISCFKKEN